MSDKPSASEQTPQCMDSSREKGGDDEPKPQGGGGSRPGGHRMMGGTNTTPGYRPKPESIKHSPFGGEKEALKSLREVKEIEDPVERLKEYAHGKATEALLGLVEPPEEAIVEIKDAQKQAFRDIRARAEEQSLKEGILYLEDVLFEFGIADDMNVNHTGVIGRVEQKTKKLKQHLERKRERERQGIHSSRSSSSETDPESTPDRWKHLTRAAKVLERYPDLEKFADFKTKAREMCEEIGLGYSEDPGEAVKKGVERLREDLTGEDWKPDRYHGMNGFRALVRDLTQGENVSDSGSSEEEDSE